MAAALPDPGWPRGNCPILLLATTAHRSFHHHRLLPGLRPCRTQRKDVLFNPDSPRLLRTLRRGESVFFWRSFVHNAYWHHEYAMRTYYVDHRWVFVSTGLDAVVNTSRYKGGKSLSRRSNAWLTVKGLSSPRTNWSVLTNFDLAWFTDSNSCPIKVTACPTLNIPCTTKWRNCEWSGYQGTQYRVLHELRTPQFPVPRGFNTPVNADNWLRVVLSASTAP